MERLHEVRWAGRCRHRPLRKRNKKCGGGEESPSHGFAVPGPFRQGGHGDRRTDCYDQFANWSRNDTLQGARCVVSGRVRAPRPYGEVTSSAVGRADRGVRPYGEAA